MSFSPTGAEPNVRVFSHFNYRDYYAIPGNEGNAIETVHGAVEGLPLSQATRLLSGCRERCPPWAKATAPTTTHSAAANTRFQAKPGTSASPRGCWINMLAEKLARMSIATNMLSPVRS